MALSEKEVALHYQGITLQRGQLVILAELIRIEKQCGLRREHFYKFVSPLMVTKQIKTRLIKTCR